MPIIYAYRVLTHTSVQLFTLLLLFRYSMNKLVQFIFIRGDLPWPPGALVAQACHASSAVNHLDHNHANTQSVFGNKNPITMEVFKVMHLVRLRYSEFFLY